MSRQPRKIDHLLSVIVLCLYAVIITIKWIMVYQNVNASVITALNIIGTVILCLMFLVVMYNACCWTDNIALKIVFIVIALFLIASAIAMRVPTVAQYFLDYNIPMIL